MSFRAHFESRQFLGGFLRRFVATCAAFCLLWVASIYADARADHRQQGLATREATLRGRSVMVATLEAYLADLKILAAAESLRRLAAGEPAATRDVARDFEVFVIHKPIVRQLRFLDRRGNEIVRIDRQGSAVVEIGAAALQNKSDRYYFQQSIVLHPPQVHVSAIDLNIEHGKIDVPWQPMLRLATPIATADGTVAGVLIVNLAATDIIDAVTRDTPPGSAPIQLLNESGYWLGGVERERLWGFMLGRETSLARSDPRLWAQIIAGSSGDVDSGHSRYIFQTVSPSDSVAQTDGQTTDSHAIRWVILGAVPGVSPAFLWQRANWPATVIGALIIAVVCFAWSRTAAARRDAEHQKRAAEAELVRNERLASLGGLVAGVAHELNTPIGNSVTLASTLAARADELGAVVASGRIQRAKLDAIVTDLKEGTTIILKGLDRASQLIGHFKQVAVDQTSEQRRCFRVGELVRDIAASLQPQFKQGRIQLTTDIDSLAVIDGYPGPLGQVLINLIENARVHAFADNAAGQVWVLTRDLPAGQIEIVIRDDGKGIPEHLRERIFEPFFTTRRDSGGSGLGLSIVFNIVTDVLGGSIRVESELGSGTTMIVRLPVATSERSAQQIGSIFDAELRKSA